ncbi:MAG: PLP-dependent aminotransferase family protein, partial [Alphaproteobacteria bacterium]
DAAVANFSVNATLLDSTAEAFRETLAGIHKDVDPSLLLTYPSALLTYTQAAGLPEHRAAAARWIARTGLDTGPDALILTMGAQQALAAAMDVVALPSRHVFVERLSYPVLKRIAAHRGVRLTGIALDGEGMVPEALDAAARAALDVRAVFVVPTLQNPTAATMSTARRETIAAVARARNLTIVEDDVYGYVATDRPAPLATHAPERTVYLTSASKCTAPGLRVGWLVAPPALREMLTDAVYATALTQPALTHEILRRWIEDGTAARLVGEMRDEIAIRHRMTEAAFADLDYIENPSSPHILLPLPEGWRSDDFVAAIAARGYLLAPIEAFAVGPDPAPPAVRISLGAVTDRAVLAGCLAAIRETLDGRRPADRPPSDRMVI